MTNPIKSMARIFVICKKKRSYQLPPPQIHHCATYTLLYSSKTVDKKEILCTVSNAGIYYSSDEFGTIYLV
jgi:hypothetical protein